MPIRFPLFPQSLPLLVCSAREQLAGQQKYRNMPSPMQSTWLEPILSPKSVFLSGLKVAEVVLWLFTCSNTEYEYI